MADTSYLRLADLEISNAARVAAYAEAGLKPHTATIGDCGCDGLADMLGDAPYTLPVDDGAPWLDPAEPASQDFAGLLITDIAGLDVAGAQRAVTDRIGDGAVVGRRRYGPRTITVTGVLIGRTSCSVDYGLRWLAAVLRGSPGCSGDDLTYLTCCPTLPAEGCCPEPCTHPECAVDAWRTLREVALTAGPEVTGRIGGCSCCPTTMLQVEFTLTAGRPHALRTPVTIAEDVTWPPPQPDDTCVEWSTDPACLDEEGECLARQPQPCPLDPACPPPVLPELPLPVNGCWCEPWTRREVCVDIPPAAAPSWAEIVTWLEIYAGSEDMRAVRVRVFPNPGGLPAEDLDPCSWISETNISYLPAQATLVLDGGRRSATVLCPGRAETPAYGIVSGPSGRPFTWPVLEGGIPYTVCISADDDTIASDAAVTLRTITREV